MATIIGFYGYSNTGKTAVIEYLIEELTKRDFKVAAVKITDKSVSIDKEGKDTWRYSEKGAKIISLSSTTETTFILKYREDLSSILNHIIYLNDIDVILVEGVNDISTEKIRFGDIPIRENTVLTYNGDKEKILKLIVDKISEEKYMADFLELKVNGKKIPLGRFPKDFIIQTVTGMIKSLRGVDDVKEVELHFKIDKEAE
ncbi:MAG TPA: molybdopterin-guanine dinucleotide biosynthesis protein B [Thermoplasmatales archaeon]|nr:molybdopterin-guanine dinucleotide biosynthesis protein B [Thermoplasmatales archaeon]